MDGLWIIILLAGALFSISQKGQNKHTSQPDSDMEAEDAQQEIERKIREILGEKPNVVPKEQIPSGNTPKESPTNRPMTADSHRTPPTKPQQIQTAPSKRAAANNTTANPKSLISKAEAPKSSEKSNAMQVAQPEDDINPKLGQIIEEFEMDKAVIYSEILRPKYKEY